MTTKIFIILTVSFLTLFTACGKSESESRAEVVFLDDEIKSNGEIVINDDNSPEKSKLISTTTQTSQGEKRLLSDKSEVVTSFDGFGNKTETRYFKDDLRLRFVVLRTSVNGRKEAMVYGYGSDTKTFYELGDMVLTASSEEIANAAEMYATKSTRELRNFMKQPKISTPALQPLPSSQFPVVPQQIQQTEPQPVSETPPVDQQKFDDEQPGTQKENTTTQENLRPWLQNQN